MRVWVLAVLGVVCAGAVACSSDSDNKQDAAPAGDAQGSSDSGLGPDALVDAGRADSGGVDGGGGEDAEPALDADPNTDAEPALDADPNTDAERALDADPNADAEPALDADPNADAEPALDADPNTDAEPALDADPNADAAPALDAEVDAGTPDTGPARTFNCGAFTTDPGWTVNPGFRAVTIADSTGGLSQPVALAFGEGPFGDLLYVVNQGNNQLISINTDTGATSVVVAAGTWPTAARLLTSITWDRYNISDGNLYVGDQGSDGDNDSTIYRVDAAGTATVFTTAPGAGLDDVYGLALVPAINTYTAGLYVSGDTDGAAVDWGRFDSAGVATPFSEVAGVEGAAFDHSGAYGGYLYAARPLGGGYAGDGTITALLSDGTAGPVLASNLDGIHANVFAPGGTYGTEMYAASWSANELLRISATGVVTVVASGLSLTNYDGNILDFSPDGNVLFVADRLANRVVCIEPL